MATPTIPLIQIYDFVTASGLASSASSSDAAGLVNVKVRATLNYAMATYNNSSPTAQLVQQQLTTFTGQDGSFYFQLVPNNRINPANTTWHIHIDGYADYDISVSDQSVPSGGWQTAAIIVSAPATLQPSNPTVSNLTVTGTLSVSGATTLSSTLAVTGAATLSSTLAVTGASTLTGGTLTNSIDRITAGTLAIGASTATGVTITPATTITGAATLSSTLGVTGLITASAGLKVAGGTAAGVGTGLFLHAANVISVAANGAEAIRVDGSASFYGGAGLADVTGNRIRLVGGYASPTAARIMFGDGTGYTMYISQGAPNAPTDLIEIGDNGGVQLGAPTGGNKGGGTLNVATGVYLNGTAYTNPDYALEHWVTGKIVRFAKNSGGSTYPGLMELKDLRRFVEENLHLPRVERDRSVDIFERADIVLEKVEELFIHLIRMDERVAALETDA